MRFGGQEMLLLFLIVLLLFGAARLPKLARSLREARDEFQKESDAPEAKTDKSEPVRTQSDEAVGDGPKPAGLKVDPQEKA